MGNVLGIGGGADAKALPSDSKEQLNVAIMQMTSIDSLEKNLQLMARQLEELEDLSELDLICFPENSIFMQLSEDAPAFKGVTEDSDHFAFFKEFADSHNVGIFLGSVPRKIEAGVANSSIWISPNNGSRAIYDKIHLFDIEIPGKVSIRESDKFVAGGQPQILDWRGWKLGCSICYDLRFPELYLEYARKGVDAMLVPSAFTVPTGQAHWHTLLKARAIESQCYVLAPAQSGGHRGESGTRHCYGHSLISGPWGDVLGEVTSEGAGVLRGTLYKSTLEKVRSQIPMGNHRRL